MNDTQRRGNGCLITSLVSLAIGITIVVAGGGWTFGILFGVMGLVGLWSIRTARANPFSTAKVPVGAVARPRDPEASSFWSDTDRSLPFPIGETFENVIQLDVEGRATMLLESVDDQGLRRNWVLMRTRGAARAPRLTWKAIDDRHAAFELTLDVPAVLVERRDDLALPFAPVRATSTGTMLVLEYPRVTTEEDVDELYSRLPALAHLATVLESAAPKALPARASGSRSAHDDWVDAVAYLPAPIHRAPVPAPMPRDPAPAPDDTANYLPYPSALAAGPDTTPAETPPRLASEDAAWGSYSPYPLHEPDPPEIDPYGDATSPRPRG